MVDLPSKPRFVAYYRVSTVSQGISGLGLEAQQRAVERYVDSVFGELIAPPFTEIETGKKKDRPQLLLAIAHAKRNKARLVVAKLDRLARNVAFVSALLESKVEFVAADFPQANNFMVHILAAVAEYEAKLISERTKAGLASRRARGLPLGGNNPENLLRGNQIVANNNKNLAITSAERMRPVIQSIMSHGFRSLRAITGELNLRGYRSERGGMWHLTSVSRLMKRLQLRSHNTLSP